MIRRLEHRGSTHFVVDYPDGTRGLLPAWMAEPWAAQLATVEVPRLALEALHTLRRVIHSALLSLSCSATMREEWDGQTGQLPATRSARVRSGALEQSRVRQEVRGEVTLLLKLLMAECIAVGATQAVEAVDE